MKNIKLFGLTAIIGCVGFSARAYDFEENGIYYNILSPTDRTLEVTTGSSIGGLYRGEVAVPGSVIYDGHYYRVTAVGNKAFRHCFQLTSVKLPESITSFGDFAFENCEALKQINIPSSLTTIGGGAFQNCLSLTSLEMPSTLTQIGALAFAYCESLESISLNEGLGSIGNMAFQYCTSLETLDLPASLYYIGSYPVLYSTNLQSINVAEGNPVYSSSDGVLYNADQTKLLVCPGGKSSVSILPTVGKIGFASFYGCVNLEDVSIPSSVVDIEELAFYGCLKLTVVDIPEGVENIGNGAFRSCGVMTEVSLPSTLLSLGNQSFMACYQLKEVTIPDNTIILGSEAFEYCYDMKSVTVGKGVEFIGNRAFRNCSSLETLTLGHNLTAIGDNAFTGCPELTTIESYSAVPPVVEGDDLFESRVYRNAQLYVIPESVEIYSTTEPWNRFMSITGNLAGVEKTNLTGNLIVRTDGQALIIENTELPVKVISIAGHTVYSGVAGRVDNLTKGIYIVVSGNESVKIAL